MLLKFILLLLFTLSVSAEERKIKASLRFLIWQPPAEYGILIEGDSSLKRETINSNLMVESEAGLTSVSCSSLRQSEIVHYLGGRRVKLLNQGGREDIAQFELTKDGEYLVLLVPNGLRYDSIALPMFAKRLSAGSVLVVNSTDSAIRLREPKADPIEVNPRKMKTMKLARPSNSTLHLTVHFWMNSIWKPGFQKPFTLLKGSKSVLLFYTSASAPALRVQILSGL